MNTNQKVRTTLALAVALLGTASLSADVVETTGGARIVGKVVAIENGTVVVATDYAGKITILQNAVSSLTIDDAMAVRLASGTRLEGRMSGSAAALEIASKDGLIRTKMDDVAATWAAGTEDPLVTALRRKWAFEATVDVSGKSGNRSQLGTAFGFRATLAGPVDTLAFFTGYDRQETDGEKSADQFKAGVDYSSMFSGKYSWYVRDEGGFDRIKDIGFYNVAAAGIGFDAIKEKKQTLTVRGGFSFRNENYIDPLTEDVNAAGLDFGLAHVYHGGNWDLVSRVSFVPSFSDLGNFRLTQESFLEMPLVNPQWKMRFGLSNDYNSTPAADLEKLDTTYFARLVLNWK